MHSKRLQTHNEGQRKTKQSGTTRGEMPIEGAAHKTTTSFTQKKESVVRVRSEEEEVVALEPGQLETPL